MARTSSEPPLRAFLAWRSAAQRRLLAEAKSRKRLRVKGRQAVLGLVKLSPSVGQLLQAPGAKEVVVLASGVASAPSLSESLGADRLGKLRDGERSR